MDRRVGEAKRAHHIPTNSPDRWWARRKRGVRYGRVVMIPTASDKARKHGHRHD